MCNVGGRTGTGGRAPFQRGGGRGDGEYSMPYSLNSEFTRKKLLRAPARAPFRCSSPRCVAAGWGASKAYIAQSSF
eukprot:scaffold16099_cov117-Isochrysis_galbana.AAC.3